MISIVVNGERREVEQGSVHDLVLTFSPNSENCIVELNGKTLPFENYASTMLKDGDSVELLRFIGGG